MSTKEQRTYMSDSDFPVMDNVPVEVTIVKEIVNDTVNGTSSMVLREFYMNNSQRIHYIGLELLILTTIIILILVFWNKYKPYMNSTVNAFDVTSPKPKAE
ncbi:developmentally-regulated membrane protein [Acrasis kona]|uniref:Developmentally-regulated membrane protein n=1 Tax=Acrasis kona TaxID=1008807 RepID=A0AAW2YYL9_9EUKA